MSLPSGSEKYGFNIHVVENQNVSNGKKTQSLEIRLKSSN